MVWSDEQLIAFATDNGEIAIDVLFVSSDGNKEESYVIGHWHVRESEVVPMMLMADDDKLNRAAAKLLLRLGCPHYRSVEEEISARLCKQHELFSQE